MRICVSPYMRIWVYAIPHGVRHAPGVIWRTPQHRERPQRHMAPWRTVRMERMETKKFLIRGVRSVVEEAQEGGVLTR